MYVFFVRFLKIIILLFLWNIIISAVVRPSLFYIRPSGLHFYPRLDPTSDLPDL